MESSQSGKELAEEHCREGFRLAWVANDFPAALRQFHAALEISPNNPQAHCQIGEIHFFSPERNLDEALKEFQEAIRLAPDWGEGTFWLASALHEMKRHSEATVAYKEAVRLTPSDPRAYISLGRCLFEMEKYAEAVQALQQGIDLKPAYGEISARMMLADAFRETRQLRRALREWQIVSSMTAVWDYEQGEPERAKKFLLQYG
jgi:cytochrome c-type biogenesis protein CcmH/NrfG